MIDALGEYVPSLTGPVGSGGGYTTAILPAASSAPGQTLYSSDVLTSKGLGSIVYSDGTNWRLPSGVLATTTPETYLISCLRAGLVNGDGQFNAGWIDRYVGPGGTARIGEIARVITATGTGAAISTTGSATTGVGGVLTLTSGTTASGVAGWRSTDFDVINNGYDIVKELVFIISALSTAADEFWALFGSTSNATVGSTADANIIGLLYDRAATWGAGGTNTNWKIITRKAGVGTTITETNVPVTTGVHCLRIYRNAAGSIAHFHIDGVQVGGDVTSNLPVSTTLRMGFDMQNTAKAGAATFCNHIATGYALRRLVALYQ